MEHIERILETHPDPASDAGDEALACIVACADCAATCTTCADACLAESDVTVLAQCIRLNLDCADICEITGKLIARPGRRDEPTLDALLRTCAAACRACAEECARHGESMKHCYICAEACRACATACDRMAASLVA